MEVRASSRRISRAQSIEPRKIQRACVCSRAVCSRAMALHWLQNMPDTITAASAAISMAVISAAPL